MLFLCGILSGACNKENEPDITPPSEGEQSNPVEMTHIRCPNLESECSRDFHHTIRQYTNMVLDSCYRQGIYRRK